MNGQVGFVTIMNWIIITGSILLLGVILAGWLASYRLPIATPAGPGKKIFTFPDWAQIGLGFIALGLLVLLGYILWIPLPFSLSVNVMMILYVFGLVIFLVGSILVLWARWTLGVMYGVSTSSAVQLKARHRLVQHGSYAVVRHPFYLGIWFVFLGLTFIYRTWALMIFFLLFLSL